MPDTETEESYESWTVAELKDELAARDLHTSGNKEELIARLEEYDTAEEAPESPTAPETSKDLVATEAEGEEKQEAPLIDPPRVYSPFELPASTAAAQAFIDANPAAVDTELKLEPQERQKLAEENIQDHVDQMAQLGVTVEDPRLAGSGAKERMEARAKEATEAAEAEAQEFAKAAEAAEKETADAV